MNTATPLPHDALLMDASHSVVVLVDHQQRLMPVIHQTDEVMSQALKLARIATELGVPVWGTEHCPDKLGPIEPGLRALCQHILNKTHFDACADGLVQALEASRKPPLREVVIAGCEAHVCLLQTALSLLAAGVRVWVVAPACGSRHVTDHALAMQRLQQAGATLVSVDMVAFEWLGHADHPRFRQALKWVKTN